MHQNRANIIKYILTLSYWVKMSDNSKEDKKQQKLLKKAEKRKIIKEFVIKNKIAVSIIGIIILLLIIFFSTKLYLMVNFLVGNDIIVRINTNSQDFKNYHNETEQLNLNISIQSNPFCSVKCNGAFIDLSNNITIENTNFSLNSKTQENKNYTLQSPEYGEGVKLYRYKLDCQGIRDTLCYSSENPTTQNILITLKYKLTDQEVELQKSLQDELETISKKESITKSIIYNIISNQDQSNQYFNSDINISDAKKLKSQIEKIQNEIGTIKKEWDKGNYIYIKNKTEELNNSVNTAGNLTEQLLIKQNSEIDNFNQAIEYAKISAEAINNLSNQPILNFDIKDLIDLSSTQYQEYENNIVYKNTIPNIILAKNVFEKELNKTIEKIKAIQKNETIKSEITNQINLEIICNLTADCTNTATNDKISSLANQEEFSSTKTCEDILITKKQLVNIRKKINLNISNEDKTESNDIIDNEKANIAQSYIKLIRNTINEETIKQYLNQIIDNKNNVNKTINEISNNNALVILTSNLPTECINDTTYNKINPKLQLQLNKSPIVLNNVTEIFQTNPAMCCFEENCSSCCTKNTCQNKISPIIFIHGHSFNKALSAEYSTQAFELIQQKLETEGVINAGFLSIDSDKNTPKGILGELNKPVSFKGSYYFDVFHNEQSSEIIQTKSENLETYSIRLKEIIDIVKYKTGSDKVTIVTHSMGGLITRRYIDIFGEDSMDKLVLIAVPNQGIDKDTAKYCALFGESRECQDMETDSLFISKLKTRQSTNITIYNIIGTDCDTNGFNGDGVVTKDNAYLAYAKNYYISGNCTTTNPLHVSILNINKYPEVFNIIENATLN